MKEIICNKGFQFLEQQLQCFSSVNFVDVNNVFVGWDTEDKCCEDHAYMYVSEETMNKLKADELCINALYDENLVLKPTPEELDPLVFDPEVLISHSQTCTCHCIVIRNDETNMRFFKLFNQNKKEECLYLLLCNAASAAAYSHGFIMTKDNNVNEFGWL